MRNRENRSTDGRMLGLSELQNYLNMGRNGANRFAEEAGAIMRIGNRKLYDRNRIDAYIEKQFSEQQAAGV